MDPGLFLQQKVRQGGRTEKFLVRGFANVIVFQNSISMQLQRDLVDNERPSPIPAFQVGSPHDQLQ